MLSIEDEPKVAPGPPAKDVTELPPMFGRGAADQTRVVEIMTGPVVCVDLHEDLHALCAVFVERGIGGAPVVDRFGHPIGMVSKTDLVRSTCEAEKGSARTVSEIMVPVPVCVKANESVARAAAVMAFERVHRVPVVDSAGFIIGIVSSLDVLGWMAREHGYVVDDRSRRHG